MSNFAVVKAALGILGPHVAFRFNNQEQTHKTFITKLS